MEGDRQQPTTISKVLDNDDLLIEIIIRVAFPTSLVRAALVCKRWLQHISDPKFLRRFCKLHPPALLGFYIADGRELRTPRFVPMLPQPPELAAVIRRASLSLDTSQGVTAGTSILDFRNGSIFTAHREKGGFTLGLHNMLCPERGMAIEAPPCQHGDGYNYTYRAILSKEECEIVSYLHVSIGWNLERAKSIVHVYRLHPGDGIWHKHLTLATDQHLYLQWEPRPVLVDNKIYMASALRKSEIIVLDLMASCLSTIQFPHGVDSGIVGTMMLSRDDDSSGVYLIHAKDLQLRIWLHKGSSWLLVENISLRDMCADLRMLDCTVEDEHTAVLWISQVGDNVEFVFLQMGRLMLYLDIKRKTMRKVYELTTEDRRWAYYIYHCKMIWPPTFPPLKDDPARNAM